LGVKTEKNSSGTRPREKLTSGDSKAGGGDNEDYSARKIEVDFLGASFDLRILLKKSLKRGDQNKLTFL
jgi:hypothetical protein